MNGETPYRFDQPEDRPALFVGRHDQVAEIAGRARRGESFAVLGGTRIGKTSLLMRVAHELRRQPETAAGLRVVPVLLSAQQFGRLARSAVFAAILSELRTSGSLHAEARDLLGVAIRDLRGGEVAEHFAFEHFVDTLREVMDLDDTVQLFVMLDEIDELRQHEWSKDFFTNTRFLISQSALRQRFNVIIAGTLSSVDLWSTAGSPFYNVVTIVEMALIDDDAVRELVRAGFDQDLPADTERELLIEVGGHPYLAQYLLGRLWEDGGDLDALERARQRFLKERRGDFQRWWGSCGDEARQLYGPIAHAREPFKKFTAIEIYGGDVDRVEDALDQLLVNGLIREVGTNRFVAGSRMFSRWALERLGSEPAGGPASISLDDSLISMERDAAPLPTRLADLLAIWDGRPANMARLNPGFYRRIADALLAAGEPWLASEVLTEALGRWPQASYRFAPQLATALRAGGAPGRARALLHQRRLSGFDDEVTDEGANEGAANEGANEGATRFPDPTPAPPVALFVAPVRHAHDPTSSMTEEIALANHLSRELDRTGARYGYTSAAAGAELMFAEAMAARGGDLHLVLPCPVEEFRRERVATAPGWGQRFDKVLEQAATVEVMGRRQALQNRAAVDYARRVALGLATFRARHLGSSVVPIAASGGGPGEDGVAATIALWQQRQLEPTVLPLPHAAADEPETDDGADHRIVALLFADTARFSQLDDVQLRRFAEHHLGQIAALVDRSAHAPVVRNTWGDGLYMVFLSVRDAGLFALELSELFRATDWEQAGMPPDLRTRVGLHAGPTHALTDPVTGQFTFMGAHVSRAARIEQITPAGTVYASRAFTALAAAEGVDDFTCEYAGTQPLPKGYGTFPVFHVVRGVSSAGGRER